MSIVIAFDGSDFAKAAIETAAGLLAPRPVVLVTVWEPLLSQLAWAPLIGAATTPATQSGEEGWEEQRQAENVSQEGARLAVNAGFPDVIARAERGDGPVWSVIVDLAKEVDASLIVTGSRGLTKARSVLLGSISDSILHHAGRPVLIVPSGGDD